MSQEGHQITRKCKRVTPGKRQSFETHFLFNYLLDVLDNYDMRKKQEKSLLKFGTYNVNSKSLIAEFM